MCSAKRPVELSPAGLSPIRPAINQRNKAMKRISAGKETLGEIDRIYDVIRLDDVPGYQFEHWGIIS